MEDVSGAAREVADTLQHTRTTPSDDPAARRRKNRRELPPSLKIDELVNVDQLAALIGVDKRTIFRWKAAGYVPEYDFQCGQSCRWKLSTVRTVIEQPHRLRRRSAS